MYPLLLNLKGRLCVVVGGGAVGRRKAEALEKAEARIRLVCPQPRPKGWSGTNLEWRQEDYRPEHLTDACLAFAAATPEVNRQVVGDAQERGIWVNCADDPARGDFFVPAVVRRGDFTIGVATGGAAPSLARRVRARLERQFDEPFGQWAELLAELRPVVRERIADPLRRRQALEDLSAWPWLRRLRRQGQDEVRSAMRARIDALAGPSPNAL